MSIILQLVFGLFALGYGIYTIYLRRNSPEKFGKLSKMKTAYGEKVGNIIHLIFYTIIPIVVGVVFLVISILNLLR